MSSEARASAGYRTVLQPASRLISAAPADIQIRPWLRHQVGPLYRRRGRLSRYLALAFLDERGKPHRAVVRYLDARRRAANAHGRDRGIHLHVAGLRELSRNEGEAALGQADQ